MPYFTHQDHRLYYTIQGEGPLLLLFPGNTASSSHMQGKAEYFSKNFQAVSMDFWGTGRSDRMETWPADWWEQGARDAAALLQHLGGEPCIAVGMSGGAVVALWLAILAPERVRAVIADSLAEKFTPAELEANIRQRNLRDPGAQEFWRHGHGQDWEQVVRADSEMILRFARRGGDFFRGRLKEIRCPVLFTGSLGDDLIPRVGEQILGMAAQVPGSQAFLAREGSHPLMWSRPDLFDAEAGRFLHSFLMEE